jgi:hypothetical protein
MNILTLKDGRRINLEQVLFYHPVGLVQMRMELTGELQELTLVEELEWLDANMGKTIIMVNGVQGPADIRVVKNNITSYWAHDSGYTVLEMVGNDNFLYLKETPERVDALIGNQ